MRSHRNRGRGPPIIPGFGLLAADPDFQEPYLKIWDLSNGRSTELKPGVTIPFEPFCGVMGVAPARMGDFSTIAPGSHGGNIDIRQLVAGSTVYFPIHVPGANFALGDVHAAQGDGEVCGDGIECEATVTARFNLLKRHAPKELFFRLPGPMPGSWNTAGWMGTTAHGPDLYQSESRIHPDHDRLSRPRARSLAARGICTLFGLRRSQDQRNRRRAQLDRVGVAADGRFHRRIRMRDFYVLTKTEGMIDVGPGRIWYESVGEGPAILLLHGGPGAPSDYLVPLMDLAEDGFRVVRYDQARIAPLRQAGRSLALQRAPLRRRSRDPPHRARSRPGACDRTILGQFSRS